MQEALTARLDETVVGISTWCCSLRYIGDEGAALLQADQHTRTSQAWWATKSALEYHRWWRRVEVWDLDLSDSLGDDRMLRGLARTV